MQAMRHGLPLPEKIQNAPSLRDGLELYYIAFMDLMASRPMGMNGAGPIWWSTVQTYCDAHHLTDMQVEAMHHHIKVMDTEYLKHVNKKANGK